MAERPLKILGINLPDPIFEEMAQHLLEGCVAERMLFTDHEVIKKNLGQFQAVYFYWDGMGGNAHRLVQALKLRAKKTNTKLCLIVEHPDRNVNIAKRRIGADEWIDMTTERYRIESSLYSVVFDDYGNDRREAAAFLGPQLDIPVPKTSPLDDTIRKVRESFKMLEKATAGSKRQTHSWVDPRTDDTYEVVWPLSEPVIFLRPDSGKALQLEEELKGLGFCRLLGVTKPEQVVRAVRDRGLRWLICWFSEYFSNSIPMMAELLENRELGRYVSTFVFPGESAVQQFLKDGSPVFHDAVSMLPNNSEQLKGFVNKSFASLQNKGHVTNVFYDFRSQWQPFQDKKKMKTQNEWTQFVKAVQEAPGNKTYWSTADSSLYWLTRGDVAKAHKLFDKIRSEKVNQFDCGMLSAFVTAKTHSLEDAANSILSLVNAHKDQLTSSRLFRVGLTLARWNKQVQLMSFLELWNELQPRSEDHHLWYITSLFYANSNDVAKRKSYLYPAVAKAPLRGQYLMELANFLGSLNNHQKAAVLWQFAARCHDTNKIHCLCEAVSAFQQAGRKDDARKVLNIILQIAPQDHRVLKVRDALDDGKTAA